MTRSTEWGLRSYQDKPDATRWGGQNVFDVYTNVRTGRRSMERSTRTGSRRLHDHRADGRAGADRDPGEHGDGAVPPQHHLLEGGGAPRRPVRSCATRSTSTTPTRTSTRQRSARWPAMAISARSRRIPSPNRIPPGRQFQPSPTPPTRRRVRASTTSRAVRTEPLSTGRAIRNGKTSLVATFHSRQEHRRGLHNSGRGRDLNPDNM